MNQASIQRTVFKVSDFLSWQRLGSLLLSPNFQRRPVWPDGAKSLLIDTVVRGIPIPIIFLRQRTDLDTLEPRREVVDGQQRLRTIISYIDPSFLGTAFNPDRDVFTVKRSHNKDLAGKSFRELPPALRELILDYEFSVHVLPSDTDDREVLQIFARMNSTGYKLNAQELRNAEWFGEFKSLAYELAYEQLGRWRQWRVFSEMDIARMLEVEETSDLMVTMLRGIQPRRQAPLDKAYKEYDEQFPQATEVATRFRTVMDRIADSVGNVLPTLAFRRKTLFNTLFTFYYDHLYGIGSNLKRVKPSSLPPTMTGSVRLASQRISAGEVPESLAKVLRGATSDSAARKARLEFLQKVLASAPSRS